MEELECLVVLFKRRRVIISVNHEESFFFQILLDSISYPLPSEILNIRSLNRDEENKNFYIFVVTIVKVLSMIRGITKRRLKFRVNSGNKRKKKEKIDRTFFLSLSSQSFRFSFAITRKESYDKCTPRLQSAFRLIRLQLKQRGHDPFELKINIDPRGREARTMYRFVIAIKQMIRRRTRRKETRFELRIEFS